MLGSAVWRGRPQGLPQMLGIVVGAVRRHRADDGRIRNDRADRDRIVEPLGTAVFDLNDWCTGTRSCASRLIMVMPMVSLSLSSAAIVDPQVGQIFVGWCRWCCTTEVVRQARSTRTSHWEFNPGHHGAASQDSPPSVAPLGRVFGERSFPNTYGESASRRTSARPGEKFVSAPRAQRRRERW